MIDYNNSMPLRKLAEHHEKNNFVLAELLWNVGDYLEKSKNRGMTTEQLAEIFGEDIHALLDRKFQWGDPARQDILFFTMDKVGRGKQAFLYGGWGVRKNPYWREIWCRSWGWHWDFVQDYVAQVEARAWEENELWNIKHGYKPLVAVGDMTDNEVMRTFLELVQGEHKDPVTKETLNAILVQLRKMLRHAKGDF